MIPRAGRKSIRAVTSLELPLRGVSIHACDQGSCRSEYRFNLMDFANASIESRFVMAVGLRGSCGENGRRGNGSNTRRWLRRRAHFLLLLALDIGACGDSSHWDSHSAVAIFPLLREEHYGVLATNISRSAQNLSFSARVFSPSRLQG